MFVVLIIEIFKQVVKILSPLLVLLPFLIVLLLMLVACSPGVIP
jgi:hypothetical protein